MASYLILLPIKLQANKEESIVLVFFFEYILLFEISNIHFISLC